MVLFVVGFVFYFLLGLLDKLVVVEFSGGILVLFLFLVYVGEFYCKLVFLVLVGDGDLVWW